MRADFYQVYWQPDGMTKRELSSICIQALGFFAYLQTFLAALMLRIEMERAHIEFHAEDYVFEMMGFPCLSCSFDGAERHARVWFSIMYGQFIHRSIFKLQLFMSTKLYSDATSAEPTVSGEVCDGSYSRV